MNKKTVATSILLVTLLMLPILGYVSAQTPAMPGVSVGNMFTYNITYFWNSTNPIDIVPFYLITQNQSTLQVTVQTVAGTTVGVATVWTYKNGTQQSSTEYDEVNGGITKTVLVYAGNLSAGDYLFPGATDLPFIINGTTIREYSGIFRQTNHIQINNTNLEGTLYSLLDQYFDKQTGILVEYYLMTVYSATPSQTVTQHILLKDSNVWAVQSPSSSPSPTTASTPSPSPPPTTSTPSGTSPNTSTGSSPSETIYIVIIAAVTIVIVAALVLFSRRKPQGATTSNISTPS